MFLADKFKKVKQGVKVVDKIDLDKVPTSSRPEPLKKEEKCEHRKTMRRMHELRDKIHNEEILLADYKKKYDEDALCVAAAERKRMQLRKDFLEKRCEVREKYNNFTLENNARQMSLFFEGLRPQCMDVVSFTVNRKNQPHLEGLALVRDENHYYIAVDLYPQPEQEDNITTCLQENEDGTFEGIWPEHTVLRKASKYEERLIRNLVDKYTDDIEKARKILDNAHVNDLDEIVNLESEIHKRTEFIDEQAVLSENVTKHRANIANLKAELASLEKADDKEEDEDMEETEVSPVDEENEVTVDPAKDIPMINFEVESTVMEQRYRHLAFIRGNKELIDMSYPYIDVTFTPFLRFRLMANVARLFNKVAATKPLTYVLSKEYIEEMQLRARNAYRGMLPQDVVGEDDSASGVIVFPHQGCEDTIIYHITNVCTLNMIFAYIRNGELMFYESYSEQQIVGQPRIDNYMCKDMRENGTDVTRLFAFVRNIVVTFLAMERDLDRTMKHFVEDGKGEEEVREISVNGRLNFELDEDVVIRDANWYSDISVDHMIPVNGYVSHRWMGKGKDKVLREVWVRPHERNGYHREAGVTK